MGIFDIFGKKDVSDSTKKMPFSIKTFFVPVRLAAHKVDSVDLHILMKNMQEEPVLTSIVVETPNGLGLDQSGISKVKETRFGYLGKGEEKEVIVPIWDTVTTEQGEYNIVITIYQHYRTYAYVLNSIKKGIDIRVV